MDNINLDISEELIKEQFLSTLNQCGITPKNNFHLIPDGRIHRFSTAEDKHGECSGAYFIHLDGWPNWAVQDFRKHDEMQKFKLDKSFLANCKFDSSKLNAMIEISRTKSAERQAKEAEQERLAIQQAREKYETAELNYGHPFKHYNTHPYLIAKHINFTGNNTYLGDSLGHAPKIRTNEKNGDKILLIPLFDSLTGIFKSLQWIAGTPNQDGTYPRGFYPHIGIKGLCAELIPISYGSYEYRDIDKIDNIFKPEHWEKTDIEIYICEGVATGFSVLELTDYESPVVCAMTCHNIIHVAQAWKERLKEFSTKIIIASDNDEAGINAARNTIKAGFADEIKAPPKVHGFNGTDWNDYINFKKGFVK